LDHLVNWPFVESNMDKKAWAQWGVGYTGRTTLTQLYGFGDGLTRSAKDGGDCKHMAYQKPY
jgi:hypothetical protein